MALRLSGSIMELFEDLQKALGPAQQAAGQQMTLHEEGPALQPAILALAHHALRVLLDELEIAHQDALKLAAPVWINRHRRHLLQQQRQMPAAQFLPERLRAAKIAVSQLLDLPHAQPPTTDSPDKLVDLI